MNSKSRKCRTCLDGTKGLQCLTKPAVGVDDDDQKKSYADLLMEVVHINTRAENEDIWPFFICNCCSRKLKAAYVYIQQARHTNEILKSTLIEYNGIHEIVTEYMDVKMEAVEDYHREEGEQTDLLNTTNIELKEEHTLTANNINCENFQQDNILKDSKGSPFDDIKQTKQETQVTGIKTKKKLKTLAKTKCKKSPKLLKTKDTKEQQQKQKDIIDSPVKCKDCDKIFENSRQLNRHQRSAHVPEELQVQCLQCEAKFARRHNMLAHMRLFHKIDNIEELELTTANTSSCDNPIATTTASPKKRFLCTLCGLKFNSQYCLNIHFRRHTGEKPYKCEFCDRAYIRLCDVQVHRRSHTGEKPYKCHLCEKAFSRANKLKIHIRSHTNERPYKCTQCEKAFKQSKHLNEHMRTHTGERPYRCEVCQSTFTQSNSLRSHQIKRKHLEATNTMDDLTSQSNEDLNISDRNLLV